MIKYLVQHKITKCFRIAFRITYISDENKYLKEKYNFLASACDVGKFLIVDEGTGIHFVLSGYAFYEGYDITKRTVMYPAIPFAKSGDEVESEIDKRREMLHENICDWWTRNMMNSVYGAPSLRTPVYSDTDALSYYPYLLSGYDIRKQKKEKNTMYGKSKTINFCVNKVIFNGPATIVIWGDGTKTVVKCADGDSYSKWAGFAMCIAKRLYGEDFHHQFRNFCGVEDDIPKKNTGDGASISEAFETLGKSACGCAESLSKALEEYFKVSDYRNVVFKDTSRTYLVLKNMSNIIDALGFVSVADCCHLVGAMIHIGDHDIGWTDISKAMIVPVKNGFLIKYPEPASRDQSDRIEKEPNEVKGLD